MVQFCKSAVFYMPWFLINAGGIINVYAELAHYGKEEIMSKTENIYNTTLEIIDYAVANGIYDASCSLPLLKPHRSKKNRQ
jgi:leucine dehydrogenase